MPSQKYLRANFRYEETTGTLIRTTAPAQRVRVGDKVGWIGKDGYYHACFLSRMQLVHRVIWVYHYGYIPKGKEIDHINQNRTDNRLSNLRLVSRTENNRNHRLHDTNTSGHVGVARKRNKWRAYITVGGKQINLGTFNTKRDAISARCAAQSSFGFSKLHGKEKTRAETRGRWLTADWQ